MFPRNGFVRHRIGDALRFRSRLLLPFESDHGPGQTQKRTGDGDSDLVFEFHVPPPCSDGDEEYASEPAA